MGLIKGFYKRYFPDIYIRKYHSKPVIEVPQHEQNETREFNNLIKNSVSTSILPNNRLEEHYKIIYEPYGLDEWFISEKHLDTIKIGIWDEIVMIESFRNHKGDTFDLVVDYLGKIHNIIYFIDGVKNSIDFISNGGNVTVFDDFGFEKTYPSHYVQNIYECNDILNKIKTLKTNAKGIYIEGFQIFRKFSNENY